MSNSTAVVRALVIYGIILPLAILLGCMLVNLPNMDRSAMVVIGVVAAVLCAPILLRWHHLLLFLSWNTPALVFFLPGSPEFWMFMAITSFTITIAHRTLDPTVQMFPVPSIVWPLAFLLVVVLGTAQLNGGIHLNSFGGGGGIMGGKRYFYIIAAIMGFFAMTSQFIPVEKVAGYTRVYLLGFATNAISNLAPYVGSVIPMLFYIFPADMNTYGALAGSDSSGEGIRRNFGLSISLCWGFFYLLARHGIKDLLAGGHRKQLLLALALFIGGTIGGFRSFLLMMLMTSLIIFWLEGLFRSRYVGVLIAGFAIALLLLPFAKSLPKPIQRAVCVIPGVEVQPSVLREAQGSSEWRIRMWTSMLPEIPKYLWLGKGLGINATEYWAEVALSKRAGTEDTTTFMMAGDYHNGPLSVIIPFGIWGVIGWLWFLAASIRMLYLNYKNGDPALKTVNAFLFAHFIARTVLFFAVFGGFYSDMAFFAGLVGFSICINGGMRKTAAVQAPAPKPAPKKFRVPTRLAPGH
ncbi:MAG: O-antigen ligase family protein [Verrucomicrobiota bacterium]